MKKNSKERRTERRETWTAWAVRARLAGIEDKNIPARNKGLGELIRRVQFAETTSRYWDKPNDNLS